MKSSRSLRSLYSHLLALLDNCTRIMVLLQVMNINEQTDTFQYELAKLIYRFKKEYDLNDYTIAGCLDFAKLSVLTETDDVIFEGDFSTDEDTDEEDNNDLDINFKF